MRESARQIFQLLIVAVVSLLVVLPWELWFDSKVALSQASQAASWEHLLGTDVVGRDLLVRLAAAVRETVLPLWLGAIFASSFGILAAIAALVWRLGRLGRGIRLALGLVAVTLLSLPIGVVVFFVAVSFEVMGLVVVMATCALFFASRSYLTVLDLHSRDVRLGYWQAHAALGGTDLARIWRYGFLGSWRQVLADKVVFHLKVVVTIEAALSYLGFGVQEPDPSLGNILAQHFDAYLRGDFRPLLWSLAVLAAVTAFPEAARSIWRRRRLARARPVPAARLVEESG